MKKTTLALLVAAFAYGFSTADVEAKAHHHNMHNHMWHHGKHYRADSRHYRHQKHHHKTHHVAVLPVVVAHISIGMQRLSLDVNGSRYGDWAVSTARAGYHTPQGSFSATRIARVYFSKKYDNSPMPYSVFFHGGNAIHGTYHIGALGHPASHGCIRLLPQHAAELYALVERYGMARTRITVTQ